MNSRAARGFSSLNATRVPLALAEGRPRAGGACELGPEARGEEGRGLVNRTRRISAILLVTTSPHHRPFDGGAWNGVRSVDMRKRRILKVIRQKKRFRL